VKIALVLDGFTIGGTELNATRTLEALGRRGIRVSVLHFHADGELKARMASAGHEMVHVPVVPLWSPAIALRIAALAGALRRVQADAVHTQDVYSNILGAASGYLLPGVPVLTSRRWKDEVPRKALTPVNAWAHRHSTLVLPNSPALVDTLRHEGVAASRIAVHENFVDDAALHLLSGAERARWRASLGIPGDALVVGYVARLTRVKRHDILIDAFAALSDMHPEARLLIVGDGDQRAALEQRVTERGIVGRTIFAGTLPNFPLSQQLFDIAVLTSENEGFPNAVVEASACAVPIVATQVGGVTDVLIDGATGLAVPVADVAATAEALQQLLRDPARRQRMGAHGRELVTTRFSESAAISRLLGIYASVARRRT
jgi:glycosyltransferase involved in cell wall biosynthesis